MDPEKAIVGQTEGGAGDENAKATGIASELMQNPEVLAAIQNKLYGMVGGSSGYIQSLPKPVKRRLKALKRLQFEMTKIEAQFYEEVHQLECKYAEKYAPLLEKRQLVVNGSVEPTDEEAAWSSEEEEEQEQDELAGETQKKLTVDGEQNSDDVKGIPGFWLTTFKNVDLLASMVQDHDQPLLEHLTDIRVSFSAQPMGFTLEFHFSPNEFFTDNILTKRYEMRSEPDDSDPFAFEGPEIIACQGCVINWNKGKNVTVKTVKKKQKHQKHGATRLVTKQVQADSFFNFFSPPEAPNSEDGEDLDEETEALLQADYEIGHFIRERIVPRAVLFFTGEAVEDEDDEYGEDDDDEDDEDYDEDGDPDYDPATDPKAAGQQDCKQQ